LTVLFKVLDHGRTGCDEDVREFSVLKRKRQISGLMLQIIDLTDDFLEVNLLTP
jgi:hypothetical protein